jgi:hypothetical protein
MPVFFYSIIEKADGITIEQPIETIINHIKPLLCFGEAGQEAQT